MNCLTGINITCAINFHSFIFSLLGHNFEVKFCGKLWRKFQEQFWRDSFWVTLRTVLWTVLGTILEKFFARNLITVWAVKATPCMFFLHLSLRFLLQENPDALNTVLLMCLLWNLMHQTLKSRRHSDQISWFWFHSTTLMPPGSPGVSREAKLSTELEFGSLVR